MSDLKSTIVNGLIMYGGLQAIFISIFLFKSKSKLLFNKLFAVLMLIESISLFERLLLETGVIRYIPHLLGVSYPLSFIKPPLLLFMAYAVVNAKFRFKLSSLLHFTPFILLLIMNVPFYSMESSIKLKLTREFIDKIPSYSSFEFYFALSFFIYIGVYLIKSIRKLNHYRSYALNNSLVNWYRLILFLYLGFLFLHLVYFIFQPLTGMNFSLINQLSLLIMTFVIQSIYFALINSSTLLNAKVQDLGKLSERKRSLKLIIDEFEASKVFLDDKLSINKFASAISLTPKEVSKIVNQKYNLSFQKLVARYRVEEAKMLMSSNSEKLKLIDIAFKSGFNNKVSFYRAFKEVEGLSPSEYLEKLGR